MYTFKKQLVSKENYPIKCPYFMKVEYITVHDTGNRASALNEIQYMIRNNHEVSFHLAVDETQVIQGLPLDRNSWSCGDGAKGTGNRQSISVEICRPTHEDQSLYTKAEENTVYVVARLLYMNGLSIDRLRKHQDWSGKKCPQVLLTERRWDEFKGRVHTVLKGIADGKIVAPLSSGTTEMEKSSSLYLVGDQVKVLESAHTYATGETMKDWVKGSIYEVIRMKENQLLLTKINSWVYMNDVEKVTDENSFLVEIVCDELNVRQQADFKSKIVGQVKRGEVYTIVMIENGLGKLKSGMGYISMNQQYVRRTKVI